MKGNSMQIKSKKKKKVMEKYYNQISYTHLGNSFLENLGSFESKVLRSLSNILQSRIFITLLSWYKAIIMVNNLFIILMTFHYQINTWNFLPGQQPECLG